MGCLVQLFIFLVGIFCGWIGWMMLASVENGVAVRFLGLAICFPSLACCWYSVRNAVNLLRNQK